MPAGLHIVRKLRPGRQAIFYVYAWRGGPMIHKTEGCRPKITAALTDAAAVARSSQKTSVGQGSLGSLITTYRAPTTPEWARLAPSTKATWSTWLDRIREEFGDAPLRAFEDRRIRGDVLAWRDRWIAQPRSADMAIQVLSRLLSWAEDRGLVSKNQITGISTLYDANRSDVIWEEADFAKFFAVASVEVREGVELASLTGFRRGDLIKLPWSAIGDHAIVWRTSKSRGKNLATVPLLPEAKQLLARIKARHAAEMAALPEAKQRPLQATVLSNSRWLPWTASGFGSRFNDAKTDAGLTVHLHDLRGTFVTRCMIAGLTDREIADIVGWDTKDIAGIRARYADQARVVVAIGKRLAVVPIR